MTEHHLKPVSFFVAVHKDAPLPPPRESYFALGLGGYRPPIIRFAFSDETGDCISPRNKHYSELTGWYWIWKNVFDVDILGLCHYRRYFLSTTISSYFLGGENDIFTRRQSVSII